MHWNVLDKKRRALLPHFAAWKKDGFYLAGGTALALQIGHRTSMDFDFYSRRAFNPLAQADKLKLPPGRLKITTQNEGTLLALAQGIQVSAFHYPYRLLAPLITTREMRLAALPDLAAMKLLAIAQRGKRRDFVDLYFLCKLFSLQEILNFTGKKFPTFDVYNGLRGLIFFEDAEHEKARLGVTPRIKISWSAVKRFFINEVHFCMRSLE